MIKINSLELENIKRIKAVQLTPHESGLTIIGGDNNQGKTSVLDAIAWALGGDKYRPSEPQRQGSVSAPALQVKLSNGLMVERKGKNGSLKVTDPSGHKGGQQLLNEFISAFALDLPKFMAGSDKEKADTLLQIIGVKEELAGLDLSIQQAYTKRHDAGVIADQKKKYAAELKTYPEAPKSRISAAELIQRQQAILAKNGENQAKRNKLQDMLKDAERLARQIADMEAALAEAREQQNNIRIDIATAKQTVEQLHDESTAELEKSIQNAEAINLLVDSNARKDAADAEAAKQQNVYDSLTGELEELRKQRLALLNGAKLPLPGLSINEDGALTYNGQAWDNMSSSDQLKVATAIVRRLNPECGFVLMDKLEQMDATTLKNFGAWAEQEGLQVIGTRVSRGSECSIIIQDGKGVMGGEPVQSARPQKTWTPGKF
jgi:hypothetical protein